MFSVITRFAVPEPHRGAFEQNFAASMRATLGDVPGLSRAQLLRPTGEGEYLATLEFDDEAAYATYLTSESFRSAHHGSAESAAADPRVATYESAAQLPE